MTISVARIDAMAGESEFFRSARIRERIYHAGGPYSEFLDRLYADLDLGIHALQKNREYLQKDSEDRITLDLLIPLRRLGYHAEHDSKSGGHIDLDIRLGTCTWLGEAKKDSKFADGLAQLLTRYVPPSGDYSHNAGGMLLYFVKSKKAAEKLAEWRRYLEEEEGAQCRDCGKNPLAFFSTHNHDTSGLDFHVRSMGVALYHEPQDASGRATRVRREAKNTRSKAPAKSAPGEKVAAKVAAGRSAAKKAPAKKAPAKALAKAPAKKAPTRASAKAPAKKAGAKTVPAKKASIKRSAGRGGSAASSKQRTRKSAANRTRGGGKAT